MIEDLRKEKKNFTRKITVVNERRKYVTAAVTFRINDFFFGFSSNTPTLFTPPSHPFVAEKCILSFLLMLPSVNEEDNFAR